MAKELRAWLDKQTITTDRIGDIRRCCFVPWDSKWNGIVRDETAKREWTGNFDSALRYKLGELIS